MTKTVKTLRAFTAGAALALLIAAPAAAHAEFRTIELRVAGMD